MAEEKNKAKKPEKDEIATAKKDIDIFAGYLKLLENPDPTLRTESAGKGLKLYDEVDRDSHAGSVLQTRYLAVVGREWEVIPAKSAVQKGRPAATTQEQKIADFVKENFLNCNFDQARQEQFQSILYGYYLLEVMWKIKNNKVVIDKLLAKHPGRFRFTEDREPRLLTKDDMIKGEEVPDRKFVVFTYGSSDNPYGKGLGQKLWWPVWFKKHGIKFWLVFLEKFGMPTVVGKYQPGTDKDVQQALLDAIDAFHTETGIKIPNTMEIDLLEAVRAGKVTYETICDYMDRQVSKSVLGQTLTTEVGDKGSYAASRTHDEVRLEIMKADADLLCERYNNTLIKWIVDFNFPGVVEYPKLWIRTEAEKDLKQVAERDKIIVADIGVKTPVRYFHETYNIPKPEEGEEVVEPSKTPSPFQKEFSEFQERYQNPVDAFTKRALNEIDMDSMIEPIEKLLNKSNSLEEFKEKLLDMRKDMDETELGIFIQKALAVAELAGRFDAQD